MGSEAVLVCEERGELYELGKFACTWMPCSVRDNENFDWSRCDLPTLSKRVQDALLGEELEYLDSWYGNLTEATLECAAAARGIFAFLERCDWKVRCVSDQHPLLEDPLRKFRLVGNRYDDSRRRP